MNQVVFVGRIVRPVDVKSVGNHGRVVNNIIAINRLQKDANGERLADFIPFVAWNHLADLLGKYCEKGHQVSISGKMQSRKYTNKDDQDVYVLECLVSDVTLLSQREKLSPLPAKQEVSITQEASDNITRAVTEINRQ